MNTGVEILLKRMETNPEDFDYQPHIGGMSRWMRLVDHAIADEIVTQEEKDALNAGMKEVKRIRFTELVMKELAGVDQEKYEYAHKTTLKREELNRLSAQEKTRLISLLEQQVKENKKKATFR